MANWQPTAGFMSNVACKVPASETGISTVPYVLFVELQGVP